MVGGREKTRAKGYPASEQRRKGEALVCAPHCSSQVARGAVGAVLLTKAHLSSKAIDNISAS